MNYLQIVQKALKRAGVREDSPSTLIGSTGIVADFEDWAGDAWVDLQNENTRWFFRQALDQTFTLNQSDDDYSMPSGLQTINWETVTAYTVAKTDESFLEYRPYIDWRVCFDTRTGGEAKPQFITRAQSAAADVLYVYPVPDQAYTLRFDGVTSIDSMSVDADVPTGLPTEFHDILMWDTVMRYASHHEDGAMLAKSQARFMQYRKKLGADQLPDFFLGPNNFYQNRPTRY